MEFHSKNLNTMWGSSDKVSLSKNKTGKACYKLTNMYHITKGSEVLIVCKLIIVILSSTFLFYRREINN